MSHISSSSPKPMRHKIYYFHAPLFLVSQNSLRPQNPCDTKIGGESTVEHMLGRMWGPTCNYFGVKISFKNTVSEMVLEWVGNDIFRFIDQLSGTYSALMQYPIVKGDKIPFYLERGIRSLTYQFCIHFFISFQTFA